MKISCKVESPYMMRRYLFSGNHIEQNRKNFYISVAEQFGLLVEYACLVKKMDIDFFFRMLTVSGYDSAFEACEPSLVLTVPHERIYDDLLTGSYFELDDNENIAEHAYYTQYYWAGWALIHLIALSKDKKITFKRIGNSFTFFEIVNRFYAYHVADVSKFVDEFTDILHERESRGKMVSMKIRNEKNNE